MEGTVGASARNQLRPGPSSGCRPDMRVGVILGFAITYPVNWRLLRAGVKEPREGLGS